MLRLAYMKRFEAAWVDIRNLPLEFWKGYRRLFQASPVAVVFLTIAEIYLGALIILEIFALSNLIMSLIGARAVGVVTTDVRSAAIWQVGLVVVAVPAMIYQKQFQGMGAEIGRQIREFTLVTSSLLMALPISAILLPFMTLAGYYIPALKIRWATISMSVLVLLTGILLFLGAVETVVYRGITIGQFIAWGGALLVHVSWIALRPYVPR